MHGEALRYAAAMAAGGVISAFVAAMIWRRRPSPGAVPLAILTAAVALWGLATSLRLLGSGLEWMVFWQKVAVVGMVAIGPAWLLFAADYTGRQAFLARRRVLLLAVLPAVTILLAFTNEWHHLHWEALALDESGAFPLLREVPGPWWWVDTAYSYVLAFAGLVLLARLFARSPGLYRRQAAAMLVAAVITISLDLGYVLLGLPSNLNLTPMLFSIVCLVIFYGFYRYRLFDLVPAARDAVFENMSDSVLVTDRLNRVVDLNPTAERLLGRPIADAIGRSVADLFADHPDVLSLYGEDEHTRQSGEPRHGLTAAEIVMGAESDSPHYHLQVSPWWDRRGVYRGQLIVLRDISERKQAEKALREAYAELEARVEERTAELRLANEGLMRSQGQVRHLLSASPTVIYTRRPHENLAFTFVSDNVLYQLGYTGQEFVADPDLWRRCLHPDDADASEEVWAMNALDAGSVEYRLLSKGGDYRWIHDEVRLLRNGEGEPVEIVGSWLDVTDRRQMEDQLRQTYKMEAIGLLAGGIAHDFNNLLTAILGYTDLLLRTVDEEPHRSDINEIRKAADRAAALTRQLLAFSRRQMLKPQVLDLNDAIRGMEGMFSRLIGEDVQLEVELSPRLGRVKADPGQIQQVCMNLVLNARDAMPKGGRVILRTKDVIVAADLVWTHPDVLPGRFVRLSVSDTGAGIDEKTKVRLFEPFFTTKGQQGTGLGLSTVYGIVSQSGGFIDVQSTLGEGTTFDIYLPRLDGAAYPAEAGFPSPDPVEWPVAAPVPEGRERVLVVEDEETVRLFVAKALRQQGYEVVEAFDAEDALELLDCQQPVDMVITDVVMPRMGGPQLADRLQRDQPGLKVLFMSGYAPDRLGQEGVLEASIPFLEKPFTTHALVAKVNELLARSA